MGRFWDETQKNIIIESEGNRELYDVMTKGAGDARRQPLNFILTTAGTDKRSICYEVYQKAKDILEGRREDPTFYPVIYGADSKDDWENEEVWKKANPSLGTTITLKKVRQAYESAMIKFNKSTIDIYYQLGV